ncbi:src-like-adapter 2 [Lampris incognitus]|uniref:src-like-adapter 2 n=1 Tax=Lampris incognitus TaxID=2546036 RepID=UPI0024B5B9F2|nr:src-like-adapter 2 [Lampris incognitus]
MGSCPIKCKPDRATSENTSEPGKTGSQRNMLVSLCDYSSFNFEQLTMHVAERLTIVSDDGDFVMVKSTTTGRQSYIPTSYIAKVTNKWLFTGISRCKAEELLMLPNNQTGAFMIRESESNRDSYSLSVLWRGNSSSRNSVKHYRICRLENGWFYISPCVTFPSLHQLVEHHSESADGLCCLLTAPCFIQGSDSPAELARPMPRPMPRAIRRPTLNWKDVSRSMLFTGNRAESEHSLVSEGLREAISSYLYMTESTGQDSDLNWDT